MIALECTHPNSKSAGTNRNGSKRYRCRDCGKYFSDAHHYDGPLGRMRVDLDKAMMVANLLLEGMGIRAASRITGMDKNTICKLVLEVGQKCQNFMDYNIVNVPVSNLEIDELWSFNFKKAKRIVDDDDASLGDSWTYVCLTETKLAIHMVGRRDTADTNRFLRKVKSAINTSKPFQVTTDGWAAYTYGVPFILGSKVNFAQLIKRFASTQEVTRYSPAQIISIEKRPIFGTPDPDLISTSKVESMNQKIRQHIKRFARLTASHSKSIDHHKAMQAIFFAWYNLCRKHSSLENQTPAMAAGLTDRPLQLIELLS